MSSVPCLEIFLEKDSGLFVRQQNRNTITPLHYAYVQRCRYGVVSGGRVWYGQKQARENKAEVVQRLKRYLKRQWFMSLTEGVIIKRGILFLSKI